MLLSLVDVFLVCYFNRNNYCFYGRPYCQSVADVIATNDCIFMADVVANDLWLMLLPIFNG